jgi:outer membrane receptor protein involved in Fe transport
MIAGARTISPPKAAPIAWWPRQTPNVGIRALKWRITAQEIPASLGVQGPGEITIFSGPSSAIWSKLIMDLQAAYALTVGNDRLTLLADVFNLFNFRRTVDYNNNVDFPVFGVPNPNFGTPTSANVSGQQFQRPFNIRLGIRYAF